MAKDEETLSSPARFFGAEVREARKRAGIAQPELAATRRVRSRRTCRRSRTAVITPDEKFIKRVRQRRSPEMHGWFGRFWGESRKWNPVVSRVVQGMARCRAAGTHRPLTWEPMLIPGLLQTARLRPRAFPGMAEIGRRGQDRA